MMLDPRKMMIQNQKSIPQNIHTKINVSSSGMKDPRSLTGSTTTINPVASTLQNASTIYTQNDIQKPTLTYEQAQQIAKENNIKMPEKLTLPSVQNTQTTSIITPLEIKKERELQTRQEQSNKGIFKKPDIMQDNLRRFKDGYNFGDITKTIGESAVEGIGTIGGTIADVGLNIGKGILSVPENMAKAGSSLIAGGADLIGQDEFANALRRQIATKNIYTDPTQKLIDKVDKASIAGNFTDDVASGIGQVGAYVATSTALGGAGNIALGKLSVPTTAILSGAGASASEAYKKADESVGLDNMTWKEKAQNATKIVGGGLIEGLSEGLFGLFGVGGMEATDMLAKSLVKKANTTLGKVATKMAVSGLGESAEELISYAGNWALDNGLINNMGEVDYSQKWDGKQVVREMLTAFLTSAITQGGTSIVQLSNAVKTELANKEKELGRPLTSEERTQEIREIADSILVDSETTQTPSETNLKTTPQNNTNLAETSPNNANISQDNVQNAQDLQKTVQMEQSLGVQQSKEIPQAIQTFIENRNKTAPGLNIQFDNTLNTDGRIIRNSDGTRTISINPNSTRAYEFVVVHEMMHDLENTQEFQELSKYVKERAITHEEFEKAKQAITEQYTKYYTENNLDMSGLNMDIETTNDMVAQALGNQQFLNELAGNKPNVFMRLYNWIKNVAFDGNKTGKTFSERRTDNKYLQELKNKFETAYKIANNNADMKNNYSIAGQKGLQNAINSDSRFKRLEDNLKRAQIMAQNNIDNEQIRRDTNWFQDKNGDWKFEFSDKDMKLRKEISLEENKTYKLGDILEHDILFTIYPQLVNHNVKIENMKNAKGSYNRKSNLIRINSKLKSSEDIQSTLIHEIQHAIQKIEGFERGQGFKASKLAYYNSLGEIEADNTKNRYVAEKQGTLNRDIIPPESSKINPKHSRLDNYLNNRTTFDKIKDGIYKYLSDRGVVNDSIYEEHDLENTNENTGLVVRGRRVKGLENSSSFSLDENNDVWQKYLDKNWNLMPNANKTTSLMPSTEQLKAQDLRQGEEAYNTLNMKKPEETQLPSTMITKERLETQRDAKINEIESRIKEKQQILQNKKRQDTKVAENLKTQIENLNKRKENIQKRYNKEIEEFENLKKEIEETNTQKAEILDDSIVQKRNYKELAKDTVTTFRRMFVDSGADIAEIGKVANDKTLYYMYNSAKQAGQSANHMISEAQTNFQGDIVGKSLIDIFEPIRKKGQDYYKEFEYYMYHLHNIDRMNLKGKALDELRMFEIENPDFATLSQEELEKLAKQEISEKSEIQIANEYLRLINKYEKTTDKPVFGESITSEKSKGIVKQFENKYPEFKEYANDIRKWNKNLQQYRIDTGLISKEQADLMNEMYSNYVPTYRNVNGISGATKNGNTVRIVNTIKKATGSNKDILPLHEQMARQVMQTVQAGRRNILGMQLYNDVIKNADKLGKYVQEIKTTKEDTDIDAEFEFEKPELEGKFVIFDNGDRIEMQVSDGVLDGLKALTPSKWESNILSKGAKWINSKFKKLVTEWNPFFILKNASRDIQDAGFYSENAKKFYENYPQAWKEITSNSELWQKYLAMGGSDASLFDFEQGYIALKEGLLHKGVEKLPTKLQQTKLAESIPYEGLSRTAIGKIGEANFLVEQAPRFAEFLRIYNQSDKSYNALMEAMYGAADITVNFGRSGTWGKFINNNLVPFFNPAVQGASKTLRTITGDGNVKGAKNYAKHIANIVGKGVLLGVTPTMINHILLSVFGGDDYDDLNERDKDMYFLIPTGEGKYVKIPKGRVLSVIGGFARRNFDYAMGDKDVFEGFGKFALEQTAPSNPFENNLYSPIQAVKNNTTWYGTPIENESLQNLRPSQRYDEGTTEFAKGLGKTFNVSPKKIDYLLDAYGGVVADTLMPLNTKKAETSGIGKSFFLDSTYSNKLSTEFYDTIEQLTYDKNDDDQVAKMQLKYMNDVKEKAQDINKQIKDLQASDVENKEKLNQVRDLRKEVNTLQRDALATYEKYGKTAENYLKNDAFIQFALKGTTSDATEETKQTNIEKTIKAYTDKDLFGAEYALLEYNKDVAGKQQEAEEKGIDADTFFKAYFAQKGIESDKNWKGETITNSKSKKQKEAIDKATPNLDKFERRTLYEIFNVGKSVW